MSSPRRITTRGEEPRPPLPGPGSSQTGRQPARLGRPPASDSADTRRRILEAARLAFAEKGYEATTNRNLSAVVGITSAAIYHYFGSKAGLYQAVHADVQAGIRARFNDAVAGASTFRDKLDAVLDEAHQMNREDPTIAQFVGAVRVDMQRNAELHALLRVGAEARSSFFDELVDFGVRNGEIDPSRQPAVQAFLTTILIGLTDAVSGDQQLHSAAIEGIKQVLDGKLLHQAEDPLA